MTLWNQTIRWEFQPESLALNARQGNENFKVWLWKHWNQIQSSTADRVSHDECPNCSHCLKPICLPKSRWLCLWWRYNFSCLMCLLCFFFSLVQWLQSLNTIRWTLFTEWFNLSTHIGMKIANSQLALPLILLLDCQSKGCIQTPNFPNAFCRTFCLKRS